MPPGDTASLAWRSGGRGPALLLLNGYAATGDDWDPRFVAALEAAFTVVRPDNRGVGASPLEDPSHLTVDAMAADLEGLLEALGLERAAVAGWSMGGFVAQRLAVRAPARVRGLALLSTDPGGPEAVRAEPAVWARLLDRSGTPREQASRLIALLFPAPLAAEVDRAAGELMAEERARLSPAALDAQEAAMERWHAEEQERPARGAPAPLVMCGSEDVVIPPANAEALAARWPGARVERMRGGGHAFMAQDPAGAARLMTAHLRA